ncbi:MAG: hypothetical protein LC772_07755, partial [Chloroflexi bacterium]|nr:hypothetical protein [Chloroflexota bacterium]
MTIIIDLPADFEDQLHRRAEAERRSVEEVVLEILATSLESGERHPSLEEVAATIQGAPRN